MHRLFLMNQARAVDEHLKESSLALERRLRQSQHSKETLHRVLVYWKWEAKQVGSEYNYTSPSGALKDLNLLEAIRIAFSSFALVASVRVRSPPAPSYPKSTTNSDTIANISKTTTVVINRKYLSLHIDSFVSPFLLLLFVFSVSLSCLFVLVLLSL